MKRIIFAVTLIAVAGMSAPAWSQAQFAIGLKGGLNFANLNAKGSVSDNYDNRTGYHAGVFSLIKIASFGIQPEIIFSKQGSEYVIDTENYEANFDYINVPIMLKFYLPLGLNLQAGPQFGFLTAGELKTTATGINSDNAKDYYKDSDAALALGAGWDLPFGLTIDARYNIGLSEISDFSLFGEQKNKVFQLSVGYKFLKLGK